MIADAEIPLGRNPLLQHVIETYASETNKTASVFRQFDLKDLAFRPHPRSSTTEDIFRHQLLSERRFFADFLGSAEADTGSVLPLQQTPEAFAIRLEELARPRLEFLAGQHDEWWMENSRFFDVERQRIWIFWRRVLHSAHHRTQLTVYLRLLEKKVVSVYGPTADVTWTGADPTLV
ncbi:MAG TPA: DinB family protein [Bryobacteraceae bacterium]|nr:DinB family protein [Bryobacteraceae bacterium]